MKKGMNSAGRAQIIQHFLSLMLPGVLMAIMLLGAPSAAVADLLVIYEFTGNQLAASDTNASITASNFGISPSVDITFGSTGTWPGSGTPYAERTGTGSWNDTQQAGARHWVFSMSAKGGSVFSITNVSFSYTRTTAGPDLFALEINGTNVTTWSNSGTSILSLNESVNLSVLQNITSATVRIYAWTSGVPSGGGAFRVDDVLVQGPVEPPPDAPVSQPASVTNVTSFTANWESVADVTSYRLDVAPHPVFIYSGTLALNETFANFSTAESTEITGSLESYTQTPGWTGERVYAADGGGMAKMGIGSARGVLVTPSLGLSSASAVTLTFDAKRWSGDSTILQVLHAPNGVDFSLLGADIVLTDDMASYTRDIENGTSLSKIQFYAKNINNYRYYLDNIQVAQASTLVPGYENRVLAGEATVSAVVTGLVSNTEYFYRVRSAGASVVSANSSTQSVTTLVMPSPESLAGDNSTSSSFDANWNAVAEAEGYYLDVSTNHGFSTFQAGYDNRDAGDVTTHTVTGLLPAVSYYYRVRAYDAGSSSANSATQQVITVIKPEPSNHATEFATSLVTHRTIMLEWTDAVDGTLPDGYLIRGSTHSLDAIPVPVDGSSVTLNTAWSGGLYANRVSQGIQADTLTGLSAKQDYFFKIFPYSNSGPQTDYKTDGTVPSVFAQTGHAPFEDFEGVTQLTYVTNTLTLGSGPWLVSNALLGQTASDKRHDQRAVRIQGNGFVEMQFDVTHVGRFSFYHANFGTDTGGRFVLEQSIDNADTWEQVGGEVVCSGTLQRATFEINQVQAVRFRIVQTAGTRINIDNIRIVRPPTVFRVF